MFEITIGGYLLTILISLAVGAAAGLIGMHMYKRRDMEEKKQELARLDGTIENQQKEFKDLREAVNTQGDSLVKQANKIAALKEKAEAVKNENKPDTIDDLINFFND